MEPNGAFERARSLLDSLGRIGHRAIRTRNCERCVRVCCKLQIKQHHSYIARSARYMGELHAVRAQKSPKASALRIRPLYIGGWL